MIIESVSKRYRDRAGNEMLALDNIDLTVENGEFVVIVGPSGCGKSTLLNIVGGLLSSSAGTVALDGGPPLHGRPQTAMVFQDSALFPWRTVLQNVALGLENAPMTSTDREAAVRRFVEMVGLKGFEHAYPHQLSGGMRQRVGIARALVVDPQLLLMDEPFSALDAQTRLLMQEELMTIWERTRHSTLYVTHNIEEAVYLADRVVVLSRRPGRIADIVPVDLPRPRRESVVRTPEFLSLADRIWSQIRDLAREALQEVAP